MKKYITSTLASALIVPGLGQVVNRQIKKGLIIMSCVFILIIVIFYHLIKTAMSVIEDLAPEDINYAILSDRLHNYDLSSLKIIIIVFLAVWIYSIIDSFLVGVRIERNEQVKIQ